MPQRAPSTASTGRTQGVRAAANRQCACACGEQEDRFKLTGGFVPATASGHSGSGSNRTQQTKRTVVKTSATHAAMQRVKAKMSVSRVLGLSLGSATSTASPPVGAGAGAGRDPLVGLGVPSGPVEHRTDEDILRRIEQEISKEDFVGGAERAGGAGRQPVQPQLSSSRRLPRAARARQAKVKEARLQLSQAQWSGKSGGAGRAGATALGFADVHKQLEHEEEMARIHRTQWELGESEVRGVEVDPHGSDEEEDEGRLAMQLEKSQPRSIGAMPPPPPFPRTPPPPPMAIPAPRLAVWGDNGIDHNKS
jgi:hypothetical protein